MLLHNRRGGAPGAVEEAEGRDLSLTHPCPLTGPKARPSATASSGYPVPRPPSRGRRAADLGSRGLEGSGRARRVR